ncbi:YbaN family protein [Rhizorhapis sp. SPR117]|uniref:YbaN family protein n=1 Tax=Rhizorhapis sp. SPR117 TaxID=2912611 RepID=UPI001F3D0FC9|nr:YbaN family protein [Rhizorhapis sp. SPR117]
MLRPFYLVVGMLCVLLGIIGVALPLLPTVPFLILAAFCFARSSPELEAKLLDHPAYGQHIRLWRVRGAISRTGKWAATIAFAASIGLALGLLDWPWPLISVAAALIFGIWIWRRPEN